MSHWVRLPQVRRVAVSGDVALRLAESGVVGTWFGAGSPDLPHEGDLIMAIRIEDEVMAPKVDEAVVATARFSQYAAADGNGAWIVSIYSARLLVVTQAITALTVAELLA